MHYLRLAFALLALALLTPTVHAAENEYTEPAFGVHLRSYHEPARGFNNVNPGVYFRLRSGFQAGLLENSLNRGTLYVGQSWAFQKVDVMLGVATGYPGAVLMPMAAVSTLFPLTQHHSLRLAALPAWSQGKPALVVHAMFEIQLTDN